jgi:MYXO-CTERM domain-containing protein
MIFVDLASIGAAPGRVADLRLSYRRPGSTERITDTVSLDYTSDPSATPDDPHLSYAEMAERYAMYNMYLGFRAATEYGVSNYSCAAAALEATRAHGKAWLAEHEADQDLAADLVLADQFLANLREAGAQPPGVPLASCPAAGPIDPAGWGDDQVRYGMACAASHASSGWLAIAAAAMLAARRRRRPCR